MTTFLSDTFTDSDDTLLSAHSPETGGTWTKVDGDGGNDYRIYSNEIRPSGGTGASYYNTADPGDADYSITVNLNYLSDQLFFMAFGGRVSTDLDNGYFVGIDDYSNLLTLFSRVSGTDTTLDSIALDHADHELRLEMIGTAIKVYVDDVETLSATDSDVTATGRVAVEKYGGPGTSDGARFVDMLAETSGAAPQVIAAAQASETDTSQAVFANHQKLVAAAQASEADSADVLTRYQPAPRLRVVRSNLFNI